MSNNKCFEFRPELFVFKEEDRIRYGPKMYVTNEYIKSVILKDYYQNNENDANDAED